MRTSSRLLYGSVIHKALEWWAVDRELSLTGLVTDAWLELTKDTSVWEFLIEYQPLSQRIGELGALIRKARPEIVNPYMTKDFKNSQDAYDCQQLMASCRDRLNNDSPWTFSKNDPLPRLYDRTMEWAPEYEEKWRFLPKPLETEFKFRIPWREWTLTGYIDTIEPLVNRETGEIVGTSVVDYKTDGEDEPEQKHRRQLVLYSVAVAELLPDLPKPILYTVDYVRLLRRRTFRFVEGDTEALARELSCYSRGVAAENYLPAPKTARPCDYGDRCCLRSAEACGGYAREVLVDW